MGCKVALIQNRPVLGGNGSSEVRVWAMGLIRRGEFPRIGEIVEEFCRQRHQVARDVPRNLATPRKSKSFVPKRTSICS